MESNIYIDPLCGEPYPFVKLCPNRDNKSVSRLDDSSRKDEQDIIFPKDERIIKDENSGKPSETNAPKIPFLNTSDIIGCTFIRPPQEDGQNFRVRIGKMIDDNEKKLS